MIIVGIISICVGLIIFTVYLIYTKKQECKSNTGIIFGFVAGATIIFGIMLLSLPKKFECRQIPQIDTVITYHSVDQKYDTLYVYNFEQW